MLTYESLRNFVNVEKKSPGLSKVPEDIFEQAKAYLEGKEKLGKDGWEIESARRLIQDIVEVRERKVLNSAFYFVASGVKPQNLLPGERQLFDRVIEVLEEHEKGKGIRSRGEVEFLQDVPEFLGPSMERLGPFKKGQAAALPSKVVEVLMKKKAAKHMI